MFGYIVQIILKMINTVIHLDKVLDMQFKYFEIATVINLTYLNKKIR